MINIEDDANIVAGIPMQPRIELREGTVGALANVLADRERLIKENKELKAKYARFRTYKLFIRKYSFDKAEYILEKKIINTNDIYHEIGKIYCNSLEEIKRIDYETLKED